jgi:hypothetical protein
MDDSVYHRRNTYSVRIVLSGLEGRDFSVLLGLCPMENLLVVVGQHLS